MPRTADPNCKDHLHVHARSPLEQQVIGELKQLALQDKIELTDLIFEGIQLIFQTRNWTPKPLQTPTQKNILPTQDTLCNCGRPIERLYRRWQDKQVYKCCKECFNKISNNKIQAYAVFEGGETKYWIYTP
ncbi:MAG: hypothetical protein FWC33_06225 [Candidatus Bathyarchaeota archaeon]|nr:hypothetical protein [Candidatus Termiticorpusculum sp.]